MIKTEKTKEPKLKLVQPGAPAVLADHEAATLFPLMDAERFSGLVENIRAHGLINDIELCEGKILDGRNRYRACLEVGIEPRYRTFEGDPFARAWALNGQRRDLVIDQRAVIFLLTVPESPELRAALDEIKAEADAKRSESQKGIPKSERGASDRGSTLRDHADKTNKSSTVMAAFSGTSRNAIERADKLVSNRGDLALLVAHGEMKPAEARREMKKDEVANKAAAFPKNKFRVIYADPPWAYSDTREGLGSGGGATGGVDRAITAAKEHYPTMSMADLSVLDVNSLAAKDAVLFCWATFPLVPKQIEVAEAWGFKYKTAFIWDKGRGSFGHYHNCQAELLLVCTRGSCTPDAGTKERQVQAFPRGKHSAKPEEWREMIDRMYPHGPRIELFRRGKAPKGWVVWGNEAQKAAAE